MLSQKETHNIIRPVDKDHPETSIQIEKRYTSTSKGEKFQTFNIMGMGSDGKPIRNNPFVCGRCGGVVEAERDAYFRCSLCNSQLCWRHRATPQAAFLPELESGTPIVVCKKCRWLILLPRQILWMLTEPFKAIHRGDDG
jgi:DNA-directed RNA polymerase subunit RPC12/RpoP